LCCCGDDAARYTKAVVAERVARDDGQQTQTEHTRYSTDSAELINSPLVFGGALRQPGISHYNGAAQGILWNGYSSR
jgi:hypothetical protein